MAKKKPTAVDITTVSMSSDDITKIKGAFDEIVAAYSFIEDKRSYVKDVMELLKQRWGISKKNAATIAKHLYKQNLDELEAEQAELNFVTEKVFSTNTTPSTVRTTSSQQDNDDLEYPDDED